MTSPASSRVGEVSFLEFRERAGLDRRRIPIEGTVETTYRCNLNCVHCYVNEPAASRDRRQRAVQLALHGTRVLLNLPAAVPGAGVFEGQFVPRHRGDAADTLEVRSQK